MLRLFDKVGLLCGLLTREKAFAGPFAVTVDVTRRCNLRCIGCPCHSADSGGNRPAGTPIQDLDVGMFDRLCGELKTMGTRTLVLSGDGEPFLHPRLLELVSIAKNAGFRTVLITNGTLLDEERAHALARSRLDLLRVSLWATSPEEYEKNHPGAKGDCFSGVVNGLRLLTSAKRLRSSALPRVALHMVLNRHNYRSVVSYAGLAIDTGCNAVSFSPLRTFFDRLAGIELKPVEEESLRLSLRQAKVRLRASGISHNIDETILRYKIGKAMRDKVRCYVAWLHPRVKVDGAVQPCNPCRWTMGNVTEQPMKEIWNGPGFREFRKAITSAAGSPRIDALCDCGFCCYISDSLRIHRLYKWLAPLSIGRAPSM